MSQYFYVQQAEQFSFYRIPKLLFEDRRFSKISIEAKLLYSILLDKMSLCEKNNWFDAKCRVYVIFPTSEIMELLKCSKQKSFKLLGELEKNDNLIERVHQGSGKPNLIYIKNYTEVPILEPDEI